MTDLPRGTVTFLFTDIEGSTNLARILGARWPDVLEQHHAILRRAIRDQRGVVVRTEGDAFFAVFRSAVDAVAAAAAAQRVLVRHPWPPDGPIRVRMGMHTREGLVGGDEYVGLDVHRAARTAGVGHGAQVLLSEATRTVVLEALPQDVTLHDLGEHRLKDFDQPHRIYQLVIEGLPRQFPPIRTLEVPTNIPLQLTTFVGREREILELEALFASSRLITLAGPGGSGKTRLALESASRRTEEYRDGIFFVDLSPILDPALVPSTIADALGLKPQPGRPPLDLVRAYVSDRRALLVLDNFEHVAPAAGVVSELLSAAPHVTILITSRVNLQLWGERVFPVPPLALPEGVSDLESVSKSEAVALFRDRAQAVRPTFEITNENAQVVAELCTRLDGLPLAIELAAAHLRLLTPFELLTHLERRLPLRTKASNVPERQRTLRGTIEWSYQLLNEPERLLFARLSVFAGGATLAAVEAVCNPGGDLGIETVDGLASLLDQSLVRRPEIPGVSRFTMLETIREFAGQRLAEEFDLEEHERRHAEFFANFAEEWGPSVRGPEAPTTVEVLASDHDNTPGGNGLGRARRPRRARTSNGRGHVDVLGGARPPGRGPDDRGAALGVAICPSTG